MSADGKTRLLLFGGTGMVGGRALKAALADDRVGAVVAIGQRTTGIDHPKPTEIVHSDFLNYGGLEDVLAKTDACVFCLAVYQSQVSKAQYEETTVRYPAALIAKLAQVNPDFDFVCMALPVQRRAARRSRPSPGSKAWPKMRSPNRPSPAVTSSVPR